MNPQYKAREISHMLGDSGAKAVVALADLVPNVLEVQDDTEVEQVISVGADVEGATEFDDFLADETKGIVDRADDDIAVQPYTSGTTGTPKGVLLTHHNIGWTTRANADVPPGGFQASDRLVGTLPLFHIYGMSVVMNGAMYSGGTLPRLRVGCSDRDGPPRGSKHHDHVRRAGDVQRHDQPTRRRATSSRRLLRQLRRLEPADPRS